MEKSLQIFTLLFKIDSTESVFLKGEATHNMLILETERREVFMTQWSKNKITSNIFR